DTILLTLLLSNASLLLFCKLFGLNLLGILGLLLHGLEQIARFNKLWISLGSPFGFHLSVFLFKLATCQKQVRLGWWGREAVTRYACCTCSRVTFGSLPGPKPTPPPCADTFGADCTEVMTAALI